MNKLTGSSGRRFTVRGKVQGVFFRASTRDVAHRLGITGHAVNLPDGTVEVLAFGKDESLGELRRWLSRGPSGARVTAVDETAVTGPVPARFSTG